MHSDLKTEGMAGMLMKTVKERYGRGHRGARGLLRKNSAQKKTEGDLLRKNSAQEKTEGNNAGRGFGPLQGNPGERFCSVNRKKPL